VHLPVVRLVGFVAQDLSTSANSKDTHERADVNHSAVGNLQQSRYSSNARNLEYTLALTLARSLSLALARIRSLCAYVHLSESLKGSVAGSQRRITLSLETDAKIKCSLEPVKVTRVTLSAWPFRVCEHVHISSSFKSCRNPQPPTCHKTSCRGTHRI